MTKTDNGKRIPLPVIFLALIFYIGNLQAQELFTASTAAAALNETNTVGSTSDIKGVGCTLAVESSIVAVGSYSLKGTSLDGSSDRIQLTPNLTSGVDYEMKVYLAEGSGANLNVTVWEGVTLATPTISPSIGTVNATLQEYTISFTTTSATPILRFYNYGSAGTDIYIDNITIKPVDTQAPTAPTLSSTGNSDTTVDLSWSGATDDTAVTEYKVFKDGTLEATLGNVSAYQVSGLTASASYNFTVTALDAAGNESVASNTVSITTNASSGGGSGNWNLSGSDLNYTAGNVGIGLSNPDEKLTVKGTIHAQEVKVDLNGVLAPDYVFLDDYELRPLEAVQNYIKEHGHLPNIPSAKEMEAQGVELKKMNMKLLEKIEELTLYILDQEARIRELEKEKDKK